MASRKLCSQSKREREESSEKSGASNSQGNSKKTKKTQLPSSSAAMSLAKSASAPSDQASDTLPFHFTTASSLLLSDIHPEKSLTEESTRVLEQIIHTVITAMKTTMSNQDGGEKIMCTLPIAQNCLSNILKDLELLKYAQDEGKKATAPTQKTSNLPSTTRVDTLKTFDDGIEEYLTEKKEEKAANAAQRKERKEMSEMLMMDMSSDSDADPDNDDVNNLYKSLYAVNEGKLNQLIITLLKEDNKEDAQKVLTLDFKKYSCTPNAKTLQIMASADRLRDAAQTMKSAFRSVVTSIFQSTGHSLTEPALLFLSAVAEYLVSFSRKIIPVIPVIL